MYTNSTTIKLYRSLKIYSASLVNAACFVNFFTTKNFSCKDLFNFTCISYYSSS